MRPTVKLTSGCAQDVLLQGIIFMEGLHHYTLFMVIVFVAGYFFIACEHVTKINKATCAILMAILCWILQFANEGISSGVHTTFLCEHLGNVSQVIFFLLGAVTIVETIDSHKGFRIISELIQINSKRKLLWLMGLLSFFLSAILDNLTTTILMVSLLKKIVDDGDDRLLIGGGIVIAANAGGAWTPIGDITTTMLWIGGQVSSGGIITHLFFPSLVSIIVSFLYLTFRLHGDFAVQKMHFEEHHREPFRGLILFLGVGSLVFVPIFKLWTGLPPFMGILFGLSVMWLVTDILHKEFPEREHLKVPRILSKIDLTAVFFFLGILLCVNALETAGILEHLAKWIDQSISNTYIVATALGFASAIVDNVPLVAASMGMYDLAQHPIDSPFWTLVAYCAGTGGSMLIIGSAAGVAFMGLEKVDFFWFLRKISLPATLGYLAGIGTYLLLK